MRCLGHSDCPQIRVSQEKRWSLEYATFPIIVNVYQNIEIRTRPSQRLPEIIKGNVEVMFSSLSLLPEGTQEAINRY